jgi:hypothetical protein
MRSSGIFRVSPSKSTAGKGPDHAGDHSHLAFSTEPNRFARGSRFITSDSPHRHRARPRAGADAGCHGPSVLEFDDELRRRGSIFH